MPFRCENCFFEIGDAGEACPHCGHVRGDGAVERIYLNPGTLLWGRYMVGQVVGAGGFGIIYKAWDNAMNMVVAVKEFFQSGLVSRASHTQEVFLIASGRTDEFFEGKRRFIEEAVRIKEFAGHPNMVAILDVFEQNNTVYQVMEFLQGDTLESFLEKNPLPIDEKISIAMMVGDALKALHGAGILHRDVSPDNVIVPFNSLEHGVKLFDFGAARFSPKEKDSLQTRVMKPGFSPPEQYGPSSGQNPQTDVYALGATLYFLLTGIKPEEATNRRIEDTLPTPKALNDEIPENISNAVLTAMALDLQLRFKTIDGFQAALTAQEPVLSPKQEMRKRRRKRRIILLSSAACILIGFAIYGLLLLFEVDRSTLPDSEIHLLYSMSGDEDDDEAKCLALTKVADDFLTYYSDSEVTVEVVDPFLTICSNSNVTINIRGIGQGNYTAEIEAFLQRGDYPAVFESTMLEPSSLGQAVDVGGLIGNTERDDNHFLSNYTRYFPDRKQVPVGFNVAAIYVNHQLSSFSRHGVSEVSELLASMPFAVAEQGLSYNGEYYGDLNAVFGSGFTLADRDRFIDNETGAYFSNTAEYFTMVEAMPGRLALLYADSDSVPAVFSSMWSMMPGSSAEEKTSGRFLQFMLNESSQYFLHTGYQSGSLPLNRQSLDRHSTEVFVDFSTFFENIENYAFR